MSTRRQFLAGTTAALAGASIPADRLEAGQDPALPPAIARLTSVRDQAVAISLEERRARLAKARRLMAEGRVSQPTYLSNLARRRGWTDAGTRSATSPPSLATSLTKVDAT